MLRFCIAIVVALTFVPARAQETPEDGPGPHTAATAASPIPEATLQALRGRVIAVQLAGAPPAVGELIGFDAATLTLALAPTRDIVTVRRAAVTGLRLGEAPPPAAPALVALPPQAPERERNFGLQLGLAPALMLDYESGHFYGFVNADVVLPMASSGDLLGFGIGLGGSFRVISSSRWRLDIFAHFTPARFGSDWNFGGGVGLGMHYTARNGFTLGFKVPILGYSGFTSGGSNSAGMDVGFYYLSGLMGLPVISLGYRF